MGSEITNLWKTCEKRSDQRGLKRCSPLLISRPTAPSALPTNGPCDRTTTVPVAP
ncbi:hypothetical protein SynNOUM97013_00128 [Synechococcus sp. NOUM97013]|nr:hypothetical protein SynNOUM97013_00128 [Synechococcus sp. NOUM97013]